MISLAILFVVPDIVVLCGGTRETGEDQVEKRPFDIWELLEQVKNHGLTS